ncbi:MAG TPA: thioesterase family protein [Candidatus Kapabacteria bacterium]|nr:thioesterase family protein [Candidatus Kapabacteria bacterium]
MFEYKTTIKMHETDAAGVLFFANQFKLVHDAYEAFLESKGFAIKYLLENTAFHLPIVHAETDYKAPLRVGDKVVVRLNVKKTGNTSFTLAHEIYKSGTELTGTGETVHVCIDKNTGAKIPLPAELLQILGPAKHTKDKK